MFRDDFVIITNFHFSWAVILDFLQNIACVS